LSYKATGFQTTLQSPLDLEHRQTEAELYRVERELWSCFYKRKQIRLSVISAESWPGVLIFNMIPLSIFQNVVWYVELDFNLAHHALGMDFVIKGLDCKKFWDQVWEPGKLEECTFVAVVQDLGEMTTLHVVEHWETESMPGLSVRYGM
jgi:hypothetical protein